MSDDRVAKIVFAITAILLTLLAVLSFNKETHTYRIESASPYQTSSESGIFTTKTKTREYVEVIYVTEDGLEIASTPRSLVEISDESKIVFKKWGVGGIVYLTIEDYHTLLEEEKK